jgi:putative metallopeptidase
VVRLSHCGVERDMYGAPKFKKSTGLPAFALRGHDVEEFIGVVRRYGAAAAGVQAMIEAAAEGPTIAAADIFACGNCAKS